MFDSCIVKMEILDLFILPIAKLVIIGSLFGIIGFFVIKAFHNAYTKSFKYYMRHKIFRKPYPEKTVLWCLDCMQKGIGWYGAKKLLMVRTLPQKQINETLWIYDQILIETQGGKNKHGRDIKGISGKIEIKTESDLPTA